MNILSTAIFLCFVALAIGRSHAAEDAVRGGRLSFGWASESVVPPKPVAIAGQYHTRISSETHDPLTVTALDSGRG